MVYKMLQGDNNAEKEQRQENEQRTERTKLKSGSRETVKKM